MISYLGIRRGRLTILPVNEMKRYLWIPILIVWALAGCRQDATPAPAPSPTAAGTPRTATGAMMPTSTPAPSPQATATPSPTASPTPPPPAIEVANQTLAEDGRLTIDRVTSPEPAWLAVHAATEADEETPPLGYTAVSPGVSENITVTIDPLLATDTLVAILHQDAGEADVFEYPGADEPMRRAETAVAVPFGVAIEFSLPTVDVSDQLVEEDGLVRVASAYAPEPAWLAVHGAAEGETGELLGHVYLEPGLHEDIPVSIPWRRAPLDLRAVLYNDAARPERFDYPQGDPPFRVEEEPVAADFRATFPPDAFILDQPFVDEEIVIERVVSDGPGWAAVHAADEEDGSELGLIIGFAPLQDGVNELVSAPVVETAVTEQMFLMLHRDEEPLGEFDFPAGDPQVTFQGQLMEPIPFRINPGNALFTMDQSLEAAPDAPTATVTIPLVITDLDTWLVVRADAEGELGEIIGRVWLPPGVNRDVSVTVEQEAVTPTLYAILHHDADGDREFDFPDGDDAPLLRNRQVIQAPFAVDEQ